VTLRAMTKLLITEITRMGPAFCVIGLGREKEKVHSIRPIPANTNGWRHFPFQRGDILQCELTPFLGAKPHVEDRVSTRSFRKDSVLSEAEIVKYLRLAETAFNLKDLFECPLHENKSGSGSFAMPLEAQRSICGTETQNLRFELCADELRVTLALSSGEVLRDLPVVDRDWRGFMDAALAEGRGPNRVARLERFLNSQFHYQIMSCPHHFVRLGLTRPYHDVCWVMLDTLFPLPKAEWLEEF
jgi:hypothetical protein